MQCISKFLCIHHLRRKKCNHTVIGIWPWTLFSTAYICWPGIVTTLEIPNSKSAPWIAPYAYLTMKSEIGDSVLSNFTFTLVICPGTDHKHQKVHIFYSSVLGYADWLMIKFVGTSWAPLRRWALEGSDHSGAPIEGPTPSPWNAGCPLHQSLQNAFSEKVQLSEADDNWHPNISKASRCSMGKPVVYCL